MDNDLKTVVIITLIGIIIMYSIYFYGHNYEAIQHNMNNPCVILPYSFGACNL